MTLHILGLLLSVVTAAGVALLSWRRRPVFRTTSLIVYAIAQLVYAIAYYFILTSFSPHKLYLLGFIYLCQSVAATTFFAFALEYSKRWNWFTPIRVGFLAIEPLVILMLQSAGPDYWLSFVPFFGSEFDVANVANFLRWGQLIYINSLMVIGILLIAVTYFHGSFSAFRQQLILVICALMPIIGSFSIFLSGPLYRGFEVYMLAWVAPGLSIIYVLRSKLLGVIPIPRAVIVEKMKDAWVVLDSDNRVVDVNSAAEDIIGKREAVFGRPAVDILSDWSNLFTGFEGAKELEIRGSMNMRDGRHYWNLRALPLLGRFHDDLGRLIIWRDITERRKAEETRMRVREAMFSLMQTISGTASRAQSIDDFLTAAIPAIISSLQSQYGVIFLSKPSGDMDEPQLVLSAHHGLSLAMQKGLQYIAARGALLEEVLISRAPLLIPCIQDDQRLSEVMRRDLHGALLIVPLVAENTFVGIIGLIREDAPVYTRDEIARLVAASEEIASFVSGYRRRQMEIALEERQRLVRDLHDSVTQRLYGLVTLTEAAQAGLDAGSYEMLIKALPRISDNARQALKEMRLFLHELQPVDVEKQGLVAVLHQRLAAVEGRADIRARLVADENLSLLLDKQVALYYIAHEALNNVMKHAHAKTVNIRITQGRANIRLDVEDDGVGFNPRSVDRGGLGLHNMRERALLVDGKLKIISIPEKGTRVSVLVKRDAVFKHR